MRGLLGLSGIALILFGAFSFNVYLGVAVVGWLLMGAAEAMMEGKRQREFHEEMESIERHPLRAGPSGEGLTRDDIR